MIRDGRRFNFTIIENDIIDDIERFDKNDLLCYMVLCRFANNETGECYPSYKTIAEKMRVGVSTAIKAVKSLIDKGVVEVQQRKNENGGDTSNLYTIVNINKDNENKKASTVPPVKADKENIKTNNSIPQNDKKYASKKEENKVLNNKHNNTVKNTFTEYEAKELENTLRSCGEKTVMLIRHEHIEPQSPMAFHIFSRACKVMYRIGAAIELKRMGYKFEEIPCKI